MKVANSLPRMCAHSDSPQFPLPQCCLIPHATTWAPALGLESETASPDPSHTNHVALPRPLHFSDSEHHRFWMRVVVTSRPGKGLSTFWYPYSLVDVGALATAVFLLYFSLQTSTTIMHLLNIMRPRTALFSRTSIPETALLSTSATFRMWPWSCCPETSWDSGLEGWPTNLSSKTLPRWVQALAG